MDKRNSKDRWEMLAENSVEDKSFLNITLIFFLDNKNWRLVMSKMGEGQWFY